MTPPGAHPRLRRGAALLVGLVAAAHFAGFVRYGILLEDEGLLLLQAARTLRGEHPYLDFHTGYSPASFYLNAALFRLFGESVIPVRVLLLAVNATTAALLFVLARPAAGGAIAAALALGWAAYLPVFVGLFAAFNVPYPSWYAACALLLSQRAFDRHLATGRRVPLLGAGVAAGVAFAFKQNFGALAALACGLTLALLHAGRDDPDRRLARVLLVLAAGFLVTCFTVALGSVEAAFILGPMLVLIGGRLLAAREPCPTPGPLTPAIVLVGAGFVAVTAAWVVPFTVRLGVAGVLHEIFLVGTNFDLVYATPYPVPLGFPAGWPALATVALAGIGVAGVAMERQRLAVRRGALGVVLGVALLAALALRWSQMPEGVVRSIMLQTPALWFFAAPALILLATVDWLRRLRAPGGRTASRDARFVGRLVFAGCAFAELYPRIDSTHLIIAMPSVLVLAGWAMARGATAWSSALRVPRPALVGAMVSATAGLALVAAIPSYDAFVVRQDGGLRARRMVTLDAATAPVQVEAERASDVGALNALLAWLRTQLEPDEPLFHFPSLPLVPFALGHPSLVRHDYFFAGRPDHLEEAEVVRTLAATRPRWVLTVNRNLNFFSNSPRYYFILRAFVQEHYVLAARFGRYDVLRRRDLPPLPAVVEEHPGGLHGGVLARLSEPLYESRRAAVRALLAQVGPGSDVGAVVAGVAADEASLQLVLRGFTEATDLRTVPFLQRAFGDPSTLIEREAGSALNYAAFSTAERSYLLAGPPSDAPTLDDVLPQVDLAQARAWLADRRHRYEVGVFAGAVLASAHDPRAVPVFRRVLAEERKRPYLLVLAAWGLVQAGRLEYLCELVTMLGDHRHEIQDAVPSLLIDAAKDHPREVALCLARGLASEHDRAREVSAWTAGAARLTATAPALRDATHDPDRRVRIAAAWALGHLHDVDARTRLARLADDADPQTRAVAVDALARLAAAGP